MKKAVKKASRKVIKVNKEKIGDGRNLRTKMSGKLKKTKREYKDLDREPAPFKIKPAKPRGA